MSAFLKSLFGQIETALDELEGQIEKRVERIKHQEERFVELRQQYWQRGKELSTLSVDREEFEALQRANERCYANQKEVTEHLKRVLGFTKALTSELRQ